MNSYNAPQGIPQMTARVDGQSGRIAAVVCLLLFGVPTAGLARSPQSASASVVCVVRDESAAVVPGASVTLKSLDAGWIRQNPTDSKGSVQFLGVPPGRYELVVSLEGFQSTSRLFELTIDQRHELAVTLVVAAAQATTDVVASDQPLIEPSKTALGRTITSRETETLPIPIGLSANFPSLAVLTPGITTDTAGSGLATAGQTGADNSFYLDGLSIDSPIGGAYQVNLPLEAVKEFRIVSNHFSPEFGQASGAIVNIVTKSGTNVLMGRGYYFRQDGAWNPTSAAARLAGTSDAEYGQTLAGGFLSGPIVRDRVFLFGAAEQGVQQTSYVDTSPVIALFRPLDPLSWRIETSLPKVFVRFDVNVGGSNVLTVRGGTQANHSNDTQREDQSAFERGRSLSNHLSTIAGLDTHVWGSSLVNEIRIQGGGGDFETSVAGFCSGCAALNYPGIKLGKPANAPQGFPNARAQATDVLTWLLAAARHTLKVGADFDFAQQSGMNPQNTLGTYMFQKDLPFNLSDPNSYPTQFVQNLGDPSFNVHEAILSVFGQDEWRPGAGVAVNAGVRWDRTRWPVPSGTHNDVAPRLGVSIDPWKTGVTVFRAAAGRYYNESALSIARDGQTGLVQMTIHNPGFSGDPSHFDPFGPNPRGPALVQYSVFRPSVMQTPYTDQLSVGMQREFNQKVGLSIDVVRALGDHLPVAGDLNYPDPVTHLRPDPTLNQIIVTQTRGQSWYTGLQVGVRVRPSRFYSASAAYTLSSSENDTDGPAAFPENQNNILADRGPAATDARHSFSASGVLELPLGCRLAALVSSRSALPYNETTGPIDANQDGVSGNERPPGVERNSERGSAFFSLNLRFSKTIALGKPRLELMFEAFNATNHDNWTGYTFVVGKANFGRPGNAGPPRQLQIGARITF